MKCFFCKYSIAPDFKDIENIEKFVTPRKKILSRDRSNVCAKHQRALSKQIKHARYLAILPFTSYQGS